jgi:hypothetical protein
MPPTRASSPRGFMGRAAHRSSTILAGSASFGSKGFVYIVMIGYKQDLLGNCKRIAEIIGRTALKE